MRKKSKTKENIAPAVVCSAPWRLVKVIPSLGYVLEVEFVGGLTGTVEMENLIHSESAGVFKELIDESAFGQVYIENGAATWPGEIDLAPDAMYQAIKKTGKWIPK